jgi:hypothetical protein
MSASQPNDVRLTGAVAAGIAVVGLTIVLYASGLPAAPQIVGVLNTLFALAGGLLAVKLWSSFEKGELLKTIWALLSLGMLLWAIGEGIWTFFLFTGTEVPYPSIADLSWALGYIPLFVALYLRYRSLGRGPSPARLWITIGLFIVIAVLAFIFIIWPIITYPDYTNPFEQALDVFYPLGDLLVGLGALLSVQALVGGKLAKPWALIGIGLLLNTVADLGFVYASWHDIYVITEAGSNLTAAIVDLIYMITYLIIAYGIYMQARLQRVM